MEQTECSETSAYKIQTPGNYPKENIQHTEHGESLKLRVVRSSTLCTGRLYPPGNTPGTHFCQRLSRPQGYSAAGRIMSMKNSSDTIGNRTRAMPEPTALPRSSCHQFVLATIYLRSGRWCVPNTSDITVICVYDSRPTEHPWRTNSHSLLFTESTQTLPSAEQHTTY